MNSALRVPNSRATNDRNVVGRRVATVLELHPPLGSTSGTEILSGTRGSESGTEQVVSGNGIREHNFNRETGSGVQCAERQVAVPMIYDTWFDKFFNRNSEESLVQRAQQSRAAAHDDEDITDRTQEKLKASHISLGFTLDKVIKDLRHNDEHG